MFSLFQKIWLIFGGKKRQVLSQLIGNTESVCPYCEFKLDKKPSRKKKCPNCGNFIFVRTRPQDKKKILVTLEQTDLLEEQWSIVNKTHKQYVIQKAHSQKVQTMLEKKLGRKPTENELKLSLLEKESQLNLSNGDWGLYRNAQLGMAEILCSEKKDMQALLEYLWVCVLDINGASNSSKISGKAFVKQEGFLAPRVVSTTSDLIEKLQLSTDEVHEIFFEVVKEKYILDIMPLTPIQAWNKVSKDLL